MYLVFGLEDAFFELHSSESACNQQIADSSSMNTQLTNLLFSMPPAIDAPAPSLPLVNSLTHLSYLTATSPRIREILSIDGGLERLVRITKGCAAGPPPAIEENLARLKGKGMTLAKGARKSPFKAFSEYKIPRSIASNSAGSPSTSTSSFSRPSSLFAEKTQAPVLTAASKQLLYTYTLAFQCIVNIGVRGSEQIRTRVVEAGALDVVVHVLERYLEGIDRRRMQAETEHKNGLRISNGSTIVGEDGSMGVTGPLLAQLEVATAEAAGALSLIVTASVEMNALLEAPQRVNTPDTIVSMEDDVAESSGQDMDGDGDATEGEDAVSNGELLSEDQRSIEGSKIETIEVVDSGIDGDGDVSMEGTGEGETERMEIASPRLSRRSISGSAAAGATGSASLPHRSSHHSVPSNASATTSTTIPSSDGGLQYRDEDVLLSLQLLAYLSKYPHVRSVFHSPSEIPPSSSGSSSPETNTVRPEFPTIPLPRRRESTTIPSHSTSHTHSHAAPSLAPLSPSASHPTTPPTLSSNVFSLVESFTHRPSNADKFTPRHTNEVQYWAGVIMRNACRKDETQNGIRQCANMQCGQWETFPREFAKCRRCRKAKYCSKGCQSKAWQLGHRYWCAKAAPKDAPVVGLEREGEQGERHNHANRHDVPMAAADVSFH